MALNFKITSKPTNLVLEKYDFPVLTLPPKVEGSKAVQKMHLNKEAVFQLNITAGQYVGLALNQNDSLVLVNLDNKEAQFVAKVNKDYSFNSAKIYNQIIKHLELDNSIENEVVLGCYKDEEDDYYCASLEKMFNEETNVEIEPIDVEDLEQSFENDYEEEFEINQVQL